MCISMEGTRKSTISTSGGEEAPRVDKKVTLPNGSTEFKFVFPTRVDSTGSDVL